MIDPMVALLAPPDRALQVPSDSPLRGGLAKIAKIMRYRRNPRTPEYMRNLVESTWPGVEVVEVDGGVPGGRLAKSDAIVLLWADAIGYGWAPVERAVFRARPRGGRVYALNGRKRTIELTPGTLLAYRLRRVVERLWIGEAVMAGALLLTAPVLVMWDFARGRR
jgi:hypothetical protein